MALRQFIPITTLPLVGGALCLDFVNTTGARISGAPRERLNKYEDLVVFCRRTALLDKIAEDVIRQEALGRPSHAAAALADLVAVRETLHRLLLAAAERSVPADADLDRFNLWVRELAAHRELRWGKEGPSWQWSARSKDLSQMRWPILQSAVDVLSSKAALADLKRCGDCDWLFLDTTKNRSRRWCKAACGNRVKARRFYERKRSEK